MKKKYYTQEFKDMIVNRHFLGATVKQLSEEFGTTERSIYNWLKKKESPIRNVQLSIDKISEDKITVSNKDKEYLKLRQENEILISAIKALIQGGNIKISI
ncbi:helix-turn-helix domain-containing protein [Viridibacillus sp. FSL R5-0888]|uniref:helix-turn-helix domain-containing protein n=1 Tax=Viridibacillus sp. FSL R5-0888 TaxID=2921663 RepID=UPI0030F7B21E